VTDPHEPDLRVGMACEEAIGRSNAIVIEFVIAAVHIEGDDPSAVAGFYL
jgi:hypothetical protein